MKPCNEPSWYMQFRAVKLYIENYSKILRITSHGTKGVSLIIVVSSNDDGFSAHSRLEFLRRNR